MELKRHGAKETWILRDMDVERHTSTETCIQRHEVHGCRETCIYRDMDLERHVPTHPPRHPPPHTRTYTHIHTRTRITSEREEANKVLGEGHRQRDIEREIDKERDIYKERDIDKARVPRDLR